jgi:hypothetical protein
MIPRAKFIRDASKDTKRLAGYAWDAMQQASSHDPEHSKELQELYKESVLAFNRTIDLQQRVSKIEIRLDKADNFIINNWKRTPKRKQLKAARRG